MKSVFTPMNKEYANDIADWHYEGIYSFYDMAADAHDLMDTKNWQAGQLSILKTANSGCHHI